MTLKPNIDYAAFLKAVEQCSGDIFFHTQEGDSLNLKSMLSQFVFTAFLTGNLQNLSGQIYCEDETDKTKLSDYLNED